MAQTTLNEMKDNRAYFFESINNLMCKSETIGAKYRCQCAFITITFYNQNYNTLIFKNTLCVIDSRINIVVSIEFSPLSSVALTNSWYQFHNGDYTGILDCTLGAITCS